MSRKSSLSALVALSAALMAFPALAATKITYAIHGSPTPVRWARAAFPLTLQVDRKVIEKLPAGTLDKAMAAWSVPDADITFQPIAVADGLRPGRDGRNTVSMAAELFKNQGALAYTTYTFDDGGNFTDVDIQLDDSLLTSDYNVQTTVQHELGHLLGLDHSAVLSSIMYPYVSRGPAAPLLDSDDRIAIATSYPRGTGIVGATLQGRVSGDSGGVFAAQVVAVDSSGHPVATALSNAAGEFTLENIPTGKYRLYAEPLDGPVDVQNLNGVWRMATTKSFPTEFFSGGEIPVEAGRVYGNLNVSVAGASTLNPKWIGMSTNGRQDFTLSTAPLTVKAGETILLAVAGDGFTSGMTELEVLNPAFRRVSDFKWSSNYVCASYVVEPGAGSGSAVILVRSGRDTAMLTGALTVQGSPKRRAVR